MSPRIQPVELVEVRADGTSAKQVHVLSQEATDACAATVTHYKRAGFAPPWISYLAVSDSSVVGICAFTAAPKSGRVEIAYHTFPPFEGRGVATAMITELLALACATALEVELFAQTSPRRNASNAVLRKLGFEFAGAVEHPEEGLVWEWRINPASNQSLQPTAGRRNERMKDEMKTKLAKVYPPRRASGGSARSR